jgi:hypothetical protein
MSHKIKQILERVDVAANGQRNTDDWHCHEDNLSSPDGIDYWGWIEQAELLAILEHDALTARVAELESKTKWLCPDSNPPEKDFEVITCSDDDVGLSTYRENQDGSHYFDGMANVSGWMPKPEALEDKS